MCSDLIPRAAISDTYITPSCIVCIGGSHIGDTSCIWLWIRYEYCLPSFLLENTNKLNKMTDNEPKTEPLGHL